jgi:hypothetical protein
MAGLTEFYCGWNEPSHASQFKWLEYTFKDAKKKKFRIFSYNLPTVKLSSVLKFDILLKIEIKFYFASIISVCSTPL